MIRNVEDWKKDEERPEGLKVKKRKSRMKEMKDRDVDFDYAVNADAVVDDEDSQMFFGWDRDSDEYEERWDDKTVVLESVTFLLSSPWIHTN